MIGALKILRSVFPYFVPSGKLTWQAGISPFSMGNIASKGPFSTQLCYLLVYQGVDILELQNLSLSQQSEQQMCIWCTRYFVSSFQNVLA